jgi:phospholipid N-methyltransferase
MLNRLRLQPDKRFSFLQGFLRHPHLVGSVIPSSRFLERRLVDIARIDRARSVVELGPGTGGTTRAILRALPDESKLLAIEINPKFVSLLRSQPDRRLIAHVASAVQIREVLAFHGLSRPDVVISGVPFSTIPPSLGRRVIRAVWSSLAPGGYFVAYQFRDRVAVLSREIAGKPEVAVELLNVPPIRIFRWRKPAGAA